jgi:hypothetical protein
MLVMLLMACGEPWSDTCQDPIVDELVVTGDGGWLHIAYCDAGSGTWATYQDPIVFDTGLETVFEYHECKNTWEDCDKAAQEVMDLAVGAAAPGAPVYEFGMGARQGLVSSTPRLCVDDVCIP